MKTRLLIVALLMLLGIMNATLLLEDNFTGTVGTFLTANGWTAHSGTGYAPMSIASPGLEYSGYLSSGIGNATSSSGNGEDVNKAFTSTNSGSLYYAFLINTATTANAGYSIHFNYNNSTFFCKFWLKAASDNVNFGLTKTSSTATDVQWDTTNYAKNTTHLIILKYTFNTGSTTDDIAYMFVNPVLGASEPSATVSHTTGNDATSLSAASIRQWDANTLARFDGIRVGTSWADVGALAGGAAPPTLTADSSSNNVDNNIDITFTDDATWRSKITAVKIGGTALTSTTDYVITAGNLQLKPSGGNSLLTTSGSKSVTVEANGYTTASVTQVINAGAPTTNSTASINLALAINTTRTVTCTAKDQYNNLVSGYTFKYDATITNNNLTTSESYTIDGTGRTATVSDVSLANSTNSSGVATFTITIPAIVDGADGVSVQVQLNNGSTNIGSAFSYVKQQTAPTVTTPTATTIKAISAVLGGNVTGDGDSSILERGTVWKTSAGVTISDNKLAEGGTSTGVFSHARSSLPENTTIYYCAYAINAIGTTLSEEASFTTLKSEPANHVSSFAAVTGTPAWSTVTVSWTDLSKSLPDGYLIKGSDVGYSSIEDPTDGATEAWSSLVHTVAQGVQTYTFTGLSELTTYYFKIFPYTNSGLDIDYRTAATVPQAQVTTEDGPNYIAGWDFQNETKRSAITTNETWISNPYTADSGIAANKDAAQISLVGGSIWTSWGVSSGNYQPNTNTWDNGNASKCWQIQFSTSGYNNVALSSKQRSSSTGPRDFKVQYSTNGSSWTDAGITVSVGSDWTTGVVDNVALPSACGNQSTLYLRWVMTSNTSVNSSTVASSGTSRIDDIAITEFYDYPAGIPVVVGDETITVSGGNANNGSGTPPAWTNPSFTPSATYSLTLIGAGPWTVSIATTALWGAFYQNGQWYTAENVGGSIVFNISPTKDEIVEIILGDQDPTLPVELSSFTATMTAQNLVSVMWVTQTETNVNGYYVYRGSSSELNAAAAVSSLIGAYNTSQQQVYQFTDTEVFEPGTYYYWLQVQDLDGSIQFHGPTTVYFDNEGNNGTPVIPKVTELKSIYPNPFNPSTTIYYSLAKAETVDFVIYNNRGQIVRSFNEGNKGIGNHSLRWNGEDQYGRSCSTGIYYIKMTAGKDSFIRKAVLMK